ncbi:transposase [Leptothoe sp. PORK10 BA2]|uniref:transposase n=1 Tax=Leptothoe sp. PORK10 BA2 TaxID=3110254 RepID=UPI002B1FB5BB|nr:transposase [Leptothoe sp. PORK10 BA2]
MISLTGLIDDEKCYDVVRQFRWPNGVHCPHCQSESITKRGNHTTMPVQVLIIGQIKV